MPTAAGVIEPAAVVSTEFGTSQVNFTSRLKFSFQVISPLASWSNFAPVGQLSWFR